MIRIARRSNSSSDTFTDSSINAARSRPGIFAWLLFIVLAAWLLLLVVVPTGMLVVNSFCDSDPDLGTPIYRFTLDSYREIFDPPLASVFEHAAVAAIVGAIVAVAITLLISRRFSVAAVRWGLLLCGGGDLSYAVRHLQAGDGTYLKIFWKTAELSGLATLLCLLVGYPVAYFIGRSGKVWRNRLLMLVMIPFWTSFLIRTYAWITILNENGLLNTTLKSLRLSMFIPASGAVLYTPAAVVIGLLYAYLPFMILPIYSSVEKLDDSLIEASLDLGAGPFRTLLNVIIPLTMPGVVAGILLVFVPAIGMFAVTDLLSGNNSPLLGSKIQDEFIGQANNYPLGAALGVVLILAFGLVFLATGWKKPRGIS